MISIKMTLGLFVMLVLGPMQLGAQQIHQQQADDKKFLMTQADGLYAKIETNHGNIYVSLAHNESPLTVANFAGLAEGLIQNKVKPRGEPYYDGMIFHRIIPGFMIQGGCPNGNGTGDPGYSFPDELEPRGELSKKGYKRGVLAMANRGPNTNGSQFFIIHKDFDLPNNYTIFGSVVKGMEVVDSIASVARGSDDRPFKEQKIIHVTILRKGAVAKAFDSEKQFKTLSELAFTRLAQQEKANAEADQLKQIESQKAAHDKIKEKYSDSRLTASGLRVQIQVDGQGSKIQAGDSIRLHCTGLLFNSDLKFWSTRDSGQQPLEVVAGVSPRLIPGMEEGLTYLREGAKARLIVPPELGYGKTGFPPTIPPHAWLMFEVEILKVN